MPRTDEPLKERMPFDVYAMMCILSFIFIACAIGFLHNELSTFWYSQETQLIGRHAQQLTKHNSQSMETLATDDNAEVSKEVEITQDDLEEYPKLIRYVRNERDKEAKPQGYVEWPEWLDPTKNPIKTEEGYNNTTNVPKEVLDKMFSEYKNPIFGPEDNPKPLEGAGEPVAPDGGAAAEPAPANP